MTYDRPITISTAGSRKAIFWPAQSLLISELYARIATPARSSETYAEYMAMHKSQQDALKDVGGYVLGTLDNGRRKSGAVLTREMIALDIDNLPAGSTDDVLKRIDGLGCGYCVYSTRKHHPSKPRLRVLLPLDRPVTADEFEPIARRAAWYIQQDMMCFDASTFESWRLMYWPSCCADGEYVYVTSDKPMLSADGMLSTYEDWRDVTAWPQVPGAQQQRIDRDAKRAGEPTEKPGVIGAFCRVYDIPAAMDTYLPGVYTPAGDHRYTFAAGSTTGGAVLYNDDKFMFSHHATDPCSGRLVNAFDMVRLHLYGHLDDEAKADTPVNRLPSSVEMGRRAAADPEVRRLLDEERLDKVARDFADDAPDDPAPAGDHDAGAPDVGSEDQTEDDTSWTTKLTHSPTTGKIEKTIDNVLLILTHSSLTAGRIGFDEFASRIMVLGSLPWDKRRILRPWDDNDDAGIRWYLEKGWEITGREKIQDAVTRAAMARSYDPVKNYLSGLVWDGVPRLDTLWIDYLGAADNEYTRATARKALAAAVARVFEPGIKYDYMPVLTGQQGIGKSTLLYKLGRGLWFTDAINSFEGKEADEIIRSMWIIEISELEALNRSEVGRVKQVLSQRVSRFRAAYGRHVQDVPRRCVFFGTCNNREYLRDSTGGRRFWPIDCGITKPRKSVFDDLDGEVDQLWAEAVRAYRQGEEPYLSGDVAQRAMQEQEEHREHVPLEGMLAQWLDRPVPKDWAHWDIQKRRMFWGGGMQGEGETVQRQRVCAAEIWAELQNGDPKLLPRRNAMEINAVMQTITGWEYMRTPRAFGPYGNQRGFERTEVTTD